MNVKPVDIVLHFLNKDTQEIFGDRAMKVELLRKGMNASVLLCDRFCIIPPGFYFESESTRMLLDSSTELIREGLICFSTKEEIEEYIEKKRRLLYQYRSNDVYSSFFDNGVLQKILNPDPVFLDRKASVGNTCVLRWDKRHERFIQDGSGALAGIYSGRIPDVKAAISLSKRMQEAAIAAQEKAFVWSIIQDGLKRESVTDQYIVRGLRRYFEQGYYLVYLDEYQANILHDFYLIDRGITFSLDSKYCANANYRWFEHFLSMLGLKDILDLPSKCIAHLKKSSSSFGALMMLYYEILNGISDKDQVLNQLAKSVNEMKRANGHNIVGLISEVREEIDNLQKETYISLPSGMFMLKTKSGTHTGEIIDVLLIVATSEEEQAIIQNDPNWKFHRRDDGYGYYLQKKEEVLFALVRPPRMRKTAAAMTLMEYIHELNPRFLAMVGFCAGKKGSVNLGDVVVAEKVYNYDNGKETDNGNFLPEIECFRIPDFWKMMIERMGDDWKRRITVNKPVDLEYERYLFIQNCLEAEGPIAVKEAWSHDDFPDLRLLIEEYRKMGYLRLSSGKIHMTKKGKSVFEDKMVTDYWGGYKAEQTRVRIGQMATGANVIEHDDIFDYLQRTYERKTIAIDMEATAVGEVSSYKEKHFLVAKGVGDYGRCGKQFANRYVEYAVYSSYAFAVEFFMEIMKIESERNL